MDHLSRIGIFLEVVRQQSFAGAARQLGITSSAVSKQVQNLEQELQVKLLNRTTRRVSVTEEGAILFERAGRALEDLREAIEQVNDLKAAPRGSLKVSIPHSFGVKFLMDHVAAFALEYPEVSLDLRMSDRYVDVAGGEFDAVVRIGALKDSSLIARKLASCPMTVCASSDYLARHGTPRSPAELSQHPGLGYTLAARLDEWRFRHRDTGEAGTAPLNAAFRCDTGEMLMQAAVQGLGVAVLPVFYTVDAIADGRLTPLLEDWEALPERNIYVLFSRNRYLSNRLRLFIDHLTNICAKLPWEC